MPDASNILTLVILLAVLTALIVLGYLLALTVRRWSRRDASRDDFTLQDLRELHARGDISLKEYDRLRAALLGRVWPEESPAPPAEPRGDDEIPPAN